MDIEGTKHEKVVLIVIAYIIGFTSGFIAFGVVPKVPAPLSEMVVETPVDGMGQNPDGSSYELPTENPPEGGEQVSQNGITSYEDGKLYATVKGERFVLSLHQDVMENSNVEGFATQGIHTDLPVYSASSDGKYVHFCEQHTEADECSHFIFDTSSNVIMPVSLEGARFVTARAVAETTAWNGDALTVGIYRSADNATPWKLVVAE
jgi:hypothetical protein